MAKSIPLDEQIVAALTAPHFSEQVQAVLTAAKEQLGNLTKLADTADVASLNPLATTSQALALRQRAADHRFEADRMEASVSALEARVSELREDEQDARDREAKDTALKERDNLAADIAREYPAIVRKLTELVSRINHSDLHLKRVGLNEMSAEAIGRSVPGHFYEGSAPIMRIASANLPMPDGRRTAWEDTPSGPQYRGLTIAMPPDEE